MISLEDAQERIFAAIQPLAAEEISLSVASGRFLAGTLRTPIDLPPADNSAVDGYAVRSEDLAEATAEKPVTLRLVGETKAGSTTPGVVEPKTCTRIFTGATVPHGADAVVMQEDVRRVEGNPVNIIFSEPARPWENIRLRGEDICEGATIGEPGDELTAQRIGLLAGVGLAKVRVARQPRVALLATGDELREPGTTQLPPGAIYESNRAALATLSQRAGAIPKQFPLIPDNLGLTKQALQTAFAECDVVVTSGGVSVGEMDFVKQAFTELGGKLEFWRVAIRPGKPFVFGLHEGKLFCGLPGNPVSAFVTFFLLVRPALLRLQGARRVDAPKTWGVLAEPMTNPAERRHFMRVVIDSDGSIKSAGTQASHMLSSMAAADGLVDVPPQANWPAGTRAAVLRWS